MLTWLALVGDRLLDLGWYGTLAWSSDDPGQEPGTASTILTCMIMVAMAGKPRILAPTTQTTASVGRSLPRTLGTPRTVLARDWDNSRRIAESCWRSGRLSGSDVVVVVSAMGQEASLSTTVVVVVVFIVTQL